MTRPQIDRRPRPSLPISALLAMVLLLGVTACSDGEATAGGSGDIVVSRAVADLPANPEVAAVRLAIENRSGEDDALVGVSSPDGTAAVHRSGVDDQGRSTMEPVDRLEIPARSTTVFEPGGLHVMVSGIERDLEVGHTLTVVLELERTGDHAVVVQVVDPRAADDDAADHDHESMRSHPSNVHGAPR